MAWERGYYYRIVRNNGRVYRIYCGRGPVGELFAENDRYQRETRELVREGVRIIRDQLDAFESLTDRANELADMIATAALLAAGYHRHHRGEWRKRRGRPETA